MAILLLTFGAAQADPKVVAALGDSLTQGYGLAPDAGLVPQLERWLIAKGHDVRLINAGVSGDTTAGGLARIDWTLTPEVQGLIVTLGANDLLRGLDPMAARDNLRGILDRAREAGVPVLLVGFPAPLNYGQDYKTTFDAIYPELSAEFGAIHYENLLAPLTDAERPMLELLQADRLHPTAEGVALIVAGLGPKVAELLEQIAR